MNHNHNVSYRQGFRDGEVMGVSSALTAVAVTYAISLVWTLAPLWQLVLLGVVLVFLLCLGMNK